MFSDAKAIVLVKYLFDKKRTLDKMWNGPGEQRRDFQTLSVSTPHSLIKLYLAPAVAHTCINGLKSFSSSE